MSAHWERVTTDAGVHVRFVAGNGEIVLTSEVYEDPASAARAVELVTTFTGTQPPSYALGTMREVDEREFVTVAEPDGTKVQLVPEGEGPLL